jgi:WD40 repeat protein
MQPRLLLIPLFRGVSLFIFCIMAVIEPVLAGPEPTGRLVTDQRTGIQLTLPPQLVEEKQTEWGTNWSARDGTLNVDAITFSDGRTIDSIRDALRANKGRTYVRDELGAENLVLSGKSSDGSWFHIEVRRSNARVRGISIVYKKESLRDWRLVVDRLVQSFVPFPPTPRSSEADSESAQLQADEQESASDIQERLRQQNWKPFSIKSDHSDQVSAQVFPNIGGMSAHDEAIVSPDGNIIAAISGGFDVRIKIWDVGTGRPLRNLEHYSYVTDMAFDPTGQRLVSSHKNGSVVLWNVKTGRALATFYTSTGADSDHAGAEAWSVAIDPQGRFLVSGDAEGAIRMWDLSTFKHIRSFELDLGRVLDLHVSARLSAISAVGDGEVKVFKFETGEILASSKLQSDQSFFHAGQKSIVDDLSFLILEKRAGCDIESVSVLDLSKGHNAATVTLLDTPKNCQRSEDDYDAGNPVPIATPLEGYITISRHKMHEARVWDLKTRKLVKALSLPKNGDGYLAWLASDLDLGLVVGSDAMVLTRLSSGLVLRTIGSLGSSAENVHRSATGKYFLVQPAKSTDSKAPNDVRIWPTGSLSSTESKIELPADAVAYDISDSGDSILFFGGGHLQTVSVGGGIKSPSIEVPAGAEINAAILSVDGRSMFVQWEQEGEFGKLLQFDVAKGQVVRELATDGHFTSLAVSPDGRFLAGGFSDATVWDIGTGAVVRELAGIDSDLRSLSFSRDSRFLFGGTRDDDVLMWDAQTGKLSQRFSVDRNAGHTNVSAVAVSKNGALAAAGLAQRAVSSGDIGSETSVKVWSTRTGELKFSLNGHESGVAAVAFSDDGRWIVSGSYDGTLRYWDQEDGAWVATIAAAQGGRWLAITDAGFFGGSSESEELVNVIEGFGAYSVSQFRKHLYRPDLVEELLKGDPERKYKDAAYKLNLKKIIQSGAAPEIKVHDGMKPDVAGSSIRISVRVVDAGGGIGQDVEWRVNGVLAGSPQSVSSGAAGGDDGYRIVTETLRLDSSRTNIVEVTAYNAAGLLASEPYRLTVDPFGISEGARPRMFILSIGVSEYDNPEWRLKHAFKDAETIAMSLEKAASGLYEKVIPIVVPEDRATRHGIDKAFSQIKFDIKPTDVFVLFVAGHGRTVQSTGTYYFLPKDLTFEGGRSVEDAIGQSVWQDWLREISAQKSILIFDTCESSAAAGLTRGGRERETAIDRLRNATGRSVITAAKQAAYEGYKGHGVLTYAILDALSEKPGLSGGEVDLYQLASHVDREVPTISRSLFGVSQRPHNKIEGNFPIGVRSTEITKLVSGGGVSAVPTHVLVRAEFLRRLPKKDAISSDGRELSAGTQVHVVEFEQEWAVIARDGQIMGYVPVDALLKLQ